MPARIVAIGTSASVTVLSTPNTRPRISGATASCSSVTSRTLRKPLSTPETRTSASAARGVVTSDSAVSASDCVMSATTIAWPLLRGPNFSAPEMTTPTIAPRPSAPMRKPYQSAVEWRRPST